MNNSKSQGRIMNEKDYETILREMLRVTLRFGVVGFEIARAIPHVRTRGELEELTRAITNLERASQDMKKALELLRTMEFGD